MKRISVLLTGAGGAAVPGLIEHLHAGGYSVVAADMDPYAAGLFLADKGYVIPKADSAEFLPAIRAICRKEQVAVIVPLVDEELVQVSGLEGAGVTGTPAPERVRLDLPRQVPAHGIPGQSWDTGPCHDPCQRG